MMKDSPVRLLLMLLCACLLLAWGQPAWAQGKGKVHSLKVPAGKAALFVQMLGYEDFTGEYNVTRDSSLVILRYQRVLRMGR